MPRWWSTLTNGLRSRVRSEWLFLVLAAVYSWHTLANLDFVPLWDGWAFFRQCYQGAAENGELRCFGHSAIVPSLLFGLTQLLDPGNPVWVYLLNLALGLLAVGWLRALLGVLAGERLGRAEQTLLAFCLGLNPVFQAQLIQPSLDFSLAILMPGLLLTLVRRRHGWAAVVGLAMVFSKETGAVLYGTCVLFYLLLLAFAPPRRFGLRALFRDRLWALGLPAAAMLGYALFFPPQRDAGSWGHALGSLVRFDLRADFLHYQLMDTFVLNFTWLVTGLALAGLVARAILGRLPGGVFPARSVAFLAASLLGLAYLLTRVPFANNPRYMLPTAALLIPLLAHGLALVGRRSARLIVPLVLLGLYALSMVRTLDPLPGRFFGTFEFGEHTLWSMSQPANRWLNGHGRDQLVYNGQFTYFHTLTEQVVQRHGLEAVYVADWRMTWNAFEDLRAFDARTLRRTLRRNSDTRLLRLVEHTDFERQFRKPGRLPTEVFFIRYPNLPNQQALAGYLKEYALSDSQTFEQDGYSLVVHRLQRRDLQRAAR